MQVVTFVLTHVIVFAKYRNVGHYLEHNSVYKSSIHIVMKYWTFLLTNILICSCVSDILIKGNLIHSLQLAVWSLNPVHNPNLIYIAMQRANPDKTTVQASREF